MHFAQHLMLSWFVAEGASVGSLRNRRIVTWAGILPDADVVPYALAASKYWLVDGEGFSVAWHHAFDEVHIHVHHHYTHGIGFVLLAGLLAALLAGHRIRSATEPGPLPGRNAPRLSRLPVAALAMGTVGLHCLCDVIASGPRWPIYPLWPLSDVKWGVSWSWTLADWPNLLILALLLVATRQYAKAKGRSPLEAFSTRLDRGLVRVIRGGSAADAPA